jgi:nicotinamide mononucleotide adenylyltransferase
LSNPYDLGREVGQMFAKNLFEQPNHVVAIYAGRFQPFHEGHYKIYCAMAEEFRRSNVYIATSNKVEEGRSPFSFAEKQQIMETMFSIPRKYIVQVKSPYAPVEVLTRFDPKTTAFVAPLGEDDAQRLRQSKYYREYSPDIQLEGHDQRGYYIVTPRYASATDIREAFQNPKLTNKKEIFTEFYGRFNCDIYELFVKRLTKGK